MVTRSKSKAKGKSGTATAKKTEHSIKWYRDNKKAIPPEVYIKSVKGTKTKTIHYGILGMETRTIHKNNLAPLGHPPENRDSLTKKYNPLKAQLTPKGLKAKGLIPTAVKTTKKASRKVKGANKGINKEKVVYNLMIRLDKSGRGASREDLEKAAMAKGISARELEVIYDNLMDKGMAWEPTVRTIKALVEDKPKKARRSKVMSEAEYRHKNEAKYRNYQADYEREMARRDVMRDSRGGDDTAYLEDAVYSDVRKGWRHTNATTRRMMRDKIAYDAFRDDDSMWLS